MNKKMFEYLIDEIEIIEKSINKIKVDLKIFKSILLDESVKGDKGEQK